MEDQREETMIDYDWSCEVAMNPAIPRFEQLGRFSCLKL